MPTGLGGEIMWLCPSLDDSPDDLSGNGNNGTYQNGMGTTSDTGSGGILAYDFDGTDDYIQTTLSDTDYRSSNGNFTISGWYKTKNKYRSSKVFSDGAVELGQESNFNRASAAGLLPSAYQNFLATSYPNSGFVWRHFLMVVEGGSIRAYENGVLMITMLAGYGVNVNSQSYDARVGFRNGDTYALAYMDDIRAYSHVLTQAEITLLASARGILGGLGGTHTHRTLLGVG